MGGTWRTFGNQTGEFAYTCIMFGLGTCGVHLLDGDNFSLAWNTVYVVCMYSVQYACAKNAAHYLLFGLHVHTCSSLDYLIHAKIIYSINYNSSCHVLLNNVLKTYMYKRGKKE